jgi:hypothetical protein
VQNCKTDTPEQVAHEEPGAISAKSAAVLTPSLLVDGLTNRANVASAGRKALYTIFLYIDFLIVQDGKRTHHVCSSKNRSIFCLMSSTDYFPILFAHFVPARFLTL